MDSQALRPNIFNEFNSIPDKVDAEVSTKGTEEEDALNFIGNSNGWRLISDFIDGLNEELDQLVLAAMAENASFQEIGQKTAVKEVTKAYLNRVKAKVSDAMEAVDGRGNDR